MIQNLTYELSVLSKSIQHKNLSAAAVHVGLSQPQLSRMISKIESELSVVLLDRSAKRKSGWTPLAHQLALAFNKGIGRLESEILSIAQEVELTEIRIGTLEGLSEIACQFAKKCFEQLNMKVVFLDVLDFRDLDAQFLSGDLHLIFTVRSPSKQKFSHVLEVGYQQMEKVVTDENTLVVSPYDFNDIEKKKVSESCHALVSNSLLVRQFWLKEMGGTGTLPVDAKTGRGKGQYSILMIGTELLSPKIWNKMENLFA